MDFEEVIVQLGWEGDDECCHVYAHGHAWRKSYASGGNWSRRAEAMAHTAGATAASAQEGVPAVGSLWRSLSWRYPSTIGCFCLSVLRLCQDCKIFLMTGHIWHLDSMVANNQQFPVLLGWDDHDTVPGAVSAAESPACNGVPPGNAGVPGRKGKGKLHKN